LKRIELVNPRVRAVIETNPDSLNIADILDVERHNGKLRSVIHGIPFLVKDNIATKDRQQTTAGCSALLGTEVPDDAAVVANLRAAGGVLLGKANLSEWASMRASYYAEGYSSRGGQNRNPYNLAEHAGGSSSGSASGLAANMCAFSIGTETDGSVMFPADRNAVVGIKPTVGLTSTFGVIPESHSMDTVGTFGRSVADATLILDILTRVESADAASRDSPSLLPERAHKPYASFLADKGVLKGARFGLPIKRVWDSAKNSKKHQHEHTVLRKLLQRMEQEGAELFEVDFPSAEEILSPSGWDWEYADGKSGSTLSEFEVVKIEFYNGLKKYLATLKGATENMRSLEDVIDYNVKHTGQEGGVPGTHPAWPTGQDNFDKCIPSKGCEDEAYRKALDYIQSKAREGGIDAALYNGSGALDGLLVPLQADGGVACSIAAKAGYPMIAIPVDVSDNSVPFGLAIIQTAGREDALIRYGSAIENLVGRRHRPTFLNYDAENYPYIGQPPE
jgi:amidase